MLEEEGGVKSVDDMLSSDGRSKMLISRQPFDMRLVLVGGRTIFGVCERS